MHQSSAQENLEKTYGSLGQAQIEQMEKELQNNPSFIHLSIERQWRRINSVLAEHSYKPSAQQEEAMDMSQALEYGKRFSEGSIYDEPVDSIDMNSLMDLYDEED